MRPYAPKVVVFSPLLDLAQAQQALRLGGSFAYDAILLAADGDSAIQNTAPEAQALADWLVGLQMPDAAPQRQCTYADGCALKSNCEVADCSVCAGLKMSCIVDKLNKELQASGTWVFGGGLPTPDVSTVVDATGAETITTDGPSVGSVRSSFLECL